MKVLHTNMLRGWGGQSNRILTEAIAAREAGVEVAFAIPDGSVLMEKAKAEGFLVFPSYQFKPPAQLWKFLPDLKRFLRDVNSWKPDIIHLHGSQDTWLAVIARRFLKHQVHLLRTKHNIFDWKTHGPNRWLYRQIDSYLSISQYIDDQIAEYPGLAGKPRACVPSIPDLTKLDAVKASIREELPKGKDDRFLWVSTGRLRSEKGFDVLLPAFAKLRETHPQCHLLIAGNGSERDTLEAQANALGLISEGMTFLGFREDVPAILKSVDAYVLASRSEGLGTAILEALAAELPVVATRVGGIPDSVHHEETGLLVPVEDSTALAAAMARMVDDETLRRSLATNAAHFVRERFSYERLRDDLVAYYQRLLGTSSLR